jgi:AAA domain
MNETITIRLPPNKDDVKFTLARFSAVTLPTTAAYLVKGLIPRAGLTVIWGPPKCGKSFWTFDVAMHVAAGKDYRGRRVKRGAVVYLALEGGHGFRARVEAYRRRHDVGDVSFYLITDRTDLVRDHPTLITAIRSTDMPALVVIDTLNRSLAGSESKDEDMSAYIRAADAIREAFQCAVAIVHHCGVDGSRPRGHTSLTGAADAQLAVSRVGADNILVTVEWMKDGPEGDQIVSKLEHVSLDMDEDGEPISSCVVVPVEGEAAKPLAARVKLTKNQQTMFSILHAAGSAGLRTEEWNERGRPVGIGVKRRADAHDIRVSLKARKMVRQSGDRWSVDHESS